MDLLAIVANRDDITAMRDFIASAKAAFQNKIETLGYDPFGLLQHVAEMEKWGNYLCDRHPQADRHTVLLAVWLHDIGHYPLPAEIDHAVRSEQTAKELLDGEEYPANEIPAVLHCVRAHRCKDVLPETLEAKIVARADSASHMTDDMYINIARDDKAAKHAFRAYDKMERDYRDLAAFPEVKKLLTPLYRAWQRVITEYERVNL